MKEFVEYIVKKLVDRPDQVKVSQIDSERTVILELSVDPADLGKVIGKNGRTAKALRQSRARKELSWRFLSKVLGDA